MMLNEKIESIVYRAWLKLEKYYYVSWDGSDVSGEWSNKDSLILELEEAFGPEWQNQLDIHRVLITYKRIE